jgi:hypothetical protein
MKALATALVMLLAVGASANTLYTKKEGSDGSITFTPVQQDEPVVEPEVPPVVNPPVGVPADPQLAEITYCQNFDTSQGLTFEYVEWQQRCDTNKDGKYKFCEDWKYTGPISFNSIWWNRGCLDDEDFSPAR